VSAALLTDLQAEISEARAQPPDERHGLAVQELAERFGLPVERLKELLDKCQLIADTKLCQVIADTPQTGAVNSRELGSLG
jgi:hypothetical protein